MPVLQPPVYIHTGQRKIQAPDGPLLSQGPLSVSGRLPCIIWFPAARFCNTAKGPLDTMKDPILYPYDEGFSYDMGFQIVAKDSDDWVKILHDGTGEFSLGVEKKSPNTARKGSCGRETDGCP